MSLAPTIAAVALLMLGSFVLGFLLGEKEGRMGRRDGEKRDV